MRVTSDDLCRVLEEFLTRLLGLGEGEAMDRLVAHDLSFSQVRTLFLLAQCGRPVAINELADGLRLSVAAAGRNVDQLLQQGLADRREDPTDRRVRLASLSEAGRTLVAGHLEAKRDGMHSLAERMPDTVRTQLYDTLDTLLGDESLRVPRNNCQENQ
ncbi:MarR family winged helix-turn-helix transcriptional regulator [Rhodococcus triatomae]